MIGCPKDTLKRESILNDGVIILNSKPILKKFLNLLENKTLKMVYRLTVRKTITESAFNLVLNQLSILILSLFDNCLFALKLTIDTFVNYFYHCRKHIVSEYAHEIICENNVLISDNNCFPRFPTFLTLSMFLLI